MRLWIGEGAAGWLEPLCPGVSGWMESLWPGASGWDSQGPVRSSVTLAVSWSFCDRETSSLVALSLLFQLFTSSVRAHSTATWFSWCCCSSLISVLRVLSSFWSWSLSCLSLLSSMLRLQASSWLSWWLISSFSWTSSLSSSLNFTFMSVMMEVSWVLGLFRAGGLILLVSRRAGGGGDGVYVW